MATPKGYKKFQITITEQMNDLLAKEAEKLCIPKTSLINVIINQYFESQKVQSSLAEKMIAQMSEQFTQIIKTEDFPSFLTSLKK